MNDAHKTRPLRLARSSWEYLDAHCARTGGTIDQLLEQIVALLQAGDALAGSPRYDAATQVICAHLDQFRHQRT